MVIIILTITLVIFTIIISSSPLRENLSGSCVHLCLWRREGCREVPGWGVDAADNDSNDDDDDDDGQEDTWDLNMHQEKKIIYGKFFDFCAEKCI